LSHAYVETNDVHEQSRRIFPKIEQFQQKNIKTRNVYLKI
jgi:hypothetical protein